MAMKSMKLSAEERKEYEPCCAPDGDNGPAYPWGLRIDLNNTILEKLGITQTPEVGTEIMLVAKARVVGASSYERDGEKPSRSSDLQITDLEIAPALSASSALYGENT